MNPIAFSIGPLSVRWYGLFIGLGIILALTYVNFESRRRGLDEETFLDAGLYMLPLAFLGARLYYVLFNLDFYLARPSEILKVWHGGLAIHGGVLAAIAFLFFYSKRKKLSFLLVLDILAPGVILAQALGRWGNFFNQEAYGGVVSQAFISRFPNFIQEGMYIGGAYHHPTFLYESVWNLLVFVFLIFLSRRAVRPPGRVLAAYVGLYSLGRFFIEDLRTDSLMMGPIQVARLVSFLGLVVSLVLVYSIYRKGKAATDGQKGDG